MFAPQLYVLAAVLAAANAAPFPGYHHTSHSQLRASSYDYVIVGGGASGLTVANRLSENPFVSVLVIEAGPLDKNEDYFNIPALAGGAVGTIYDFNTTYAPNPAIGNRTVSIPQGRVVGGSTKLNRMVFDSGSKADFDRWAELGNPGWNWEGLLPYFHKREKFTPPHADIVSTFGVGYDSAAHGASGPISVGYSPFFWPQTKNIIDATKELGLPMPVDQAGGSPIGGFFSPHNLDPVTANRSSAREAYYNPVQTRPNLELLTGNQVTKLVLKESYGGSVVTGVEFAPSAGAAKSTIAVTREAILAAGALHTPQILQVSGIGSRTLLDKIGVKTHVDLPAVGENLQDHALVATVASITTQDRTFSELSSDSTFAAEALAQYKQSPARGPYTSPTGDFLLFLPYTTYTNATIPNSSGATHLPADTPAEVIAGYQVQQAQLNAHLGRTDSAPLEFIWDTGVVILGLQHPFSRGNVRAASNSTFDMPIASPGFLSDPADVKMLVEAVKFARTLRGTAAIQALQPVEIVPGADVTSDEAIEAFVRGSVGTMYHPSGSAKMGPRKLGGVVDAKLKVYGTLNLRVVDASVFPLLPATHTMTAVYGVAEKAADLIKTTF